MKVETGLFDNMVLQRTGRNVSDARITGTCVNDGVVTAVVKNGAQHMKAFAGVRVGRAAGGTFNVRLRGLPAGGPYTVTLTVAESKDAPAERMIVKNVLVGDVWILAGQSNMEGIGGRRHALKPDSRVRAFYMNDTWAPAADPLHDFSIAVDQVHADLNGGAPTPPAPHLGVGPGVAFAQELRRITRVPQGVIACAHGGTSMTQWDPQLKNGEKSSLYGAMLRRFIKNGSRVAGVFWYQGCSDTDEGSVDLYTERMTGFIRSVRSDFGSRTLPFVMVQIAGVCGELLGQANWNGVQEQQRLLPRSIRNLAVVPAIDLDMEDSIHIAGNEQNRLGRRAARAMALLSDRIKSGKPPIAFKSVKVKRDKLSGMADVVVTFDNVSGKLTAPGRPEGFALTPRIGELRHAFIFRTELAGNTAVLKSVLPPSEAESMFLHYGFGRRPYCNITDTADRSLPVMGPVYLGGCRVYAPFITTIRVSAFQPSAGKLYGLTYPADRDALQMTPRTFDGTFCNLHPEITASTIDDLLVYFGIRISCSEPMDLEIDLGYDGPVKLWTDGVEQLFDPDGINPALPGDALIPVHFDTGEHEVLVALGSNNRKAWGIFMRLGRTGIPLEQIKKGPGGYAWPIVI